MLDIASGTDVYTAHDQHVGTVARIVLDPRTRAISHVVVSKGVLFREDRLVPIGDIATATPERINLRREVGIDDLLPFEEQRYELYPEGEPPLGSEDQGVKVAMPLSGLTGQTVPSVDAELMPVNRRNVPDRLTALKAGVAVFAADAQEVGQLERIVTDDTGLPTHIVVQEGALLPDRRAIPIDWVKEITEDSIVLDADRERIEAIAPLGPDD